MYIEFVIADNFLLTYLAGAAATRLCHKKVCVWRLAVASVLGTIVAVFYPFMRLNVAAQFAVKISLGAALCAVLFVKTPRPITSSLLFFGCTFMFGGACFAIGLVLYSDVSAATEFSRKCPLFAVLGIGAAMYACLRYCIKRLRVTRARAPYKYEIDVKIYGTTLRFDSFLDTGNCVFDDVTGLPVVITDFAMFSSKLNTDASREFLKSVDGLRKISVRTAAGEASAFVLKPTEITVYSDGAGHKIDAMIGLVCGSRMSAAHEMLLNPAVVSGAFR